MKKAKEFIYNVIIIITTSLLIKIMVSIFEIYISNKIGAVAVGVYQLVMSIYFLAITLATSGIHLATTIIISEELEKEATCNLQSVMKKCLSYSAIFGFIAGSFLYIFSEYITMRWLVNKISPITLRILAISLPFVAIYSCLAGYFSATRKISKTSISQIFSQIIRTLVVSFALNMLFPNDIEYSCLSLALGGTIAEIFSFIFTYIAYKKDISKRYFTYTKDKNINKRIVSIALPIALTSYLRSGLNTLKQLLIPIRLKLSGMSYEKALANYGTITGMALPIIFFPSVIVYSYSSLLIPEFSGYNITHDKSSMLTDIDKVFKVTLYYSICITGLLFTFGNELGNTFYNNPSVGWYIQILSPLVVLIYLDNVIDNILKGLGKQVSVMCCNILDLIVSVSFIYFLLPIFNVYGYIIVMFISEILNYTISVITLFKTTDFKFRYIDWVILPTLYIILSGTITKLLSTPHLILNILMFVLIYIILCFVTKMFKSPKNFTY